MPKDEQIKVPCCPDLFRDDNCDVMHFTRTLNYPYTKKGYNLNVQLLLEFKATKCSLGLALGAPVYSITLLPGEKVKLFSSDKRSQFSYDKDTHIATRSEMMSEDTYFMLAFQNYFSQQESRQSGSSTDENKSSWNFKGDTDAGLDVLSLGVSASASASGNYDSISTRDYLNMQSSMLRTAASQSVQATHTAYSISIGQVDTREHIEGKSEEHYEACSREFRNDNTAHAVSYIFYRLNTKQVLKIELQKIEILTLLSTVQRISPKAQFQVLKPLQPSDHSSILKELVTELGQMGILDSKGEIVKEMKEAFYYEYEFSLPTPGIIVKGCLDECITLEPERERYYKLKNDLLERQIELLDKAQEYRCCPPSPTTINNNP